MARRAGPWAGAGVCAEWQGRPGRGTAPFTSNRGKRSGPHPTPIPPEGLGHQTEPGRPAPPAVAFETHRGIPVLDGKGVGATRTQGSYLLRSGDSSWGRPWGGLWALDPQTLSCKALERGQAGERGRARRGPAGEGKTVGPPGCVGVPGKARGRAQWRAPALKVPSTVSGSHPVIFEVEPARMG